MKVPTTDLWFASTPTNGRPVAKADHYGVYSTHLYAQFVAENVANHDPATPLFVHSARSFLRSAVFCSAVKALLHACFGLNTTRKQVVPTAYLSGVYILLPHHVLVCLAIEGTLPSKGCIIL